MKCFYHSRDLDGYCSGAIIKHKYPEAILIGLDYGEKFPMDEIDIERDKEIIMVDVSLPMEDMFELAEKCGRENFTWIDHHISAIKEYNEYLENTDVRFCVRLEDGIAACEGAWKYCFPDTELPRAVHLLGTYDTWRKEELGADWHKEVLPFQYGMRVQCSDPLELEPDLLSNHGHLMIQNIIDQGKAIITYQSKQNTSNCEKTSFETEFEGLRVIAMNSSMSNFNSMTFESHYDPEKHDIMMPFVFKGNSWTVSMYSDKDEVDCSVIAKSRGGGGHKGAAGFQAESMIAVFPEIFSH